MVTLEEKYFTNTELIDALEQDGKTFESVLTEGLSKNGWAMNTGSKFSSEKNNIKNIAKHLLRRITQIISNKPQNENEILFKNIELKADFEIDTLINDNKTFKNSFADDIQAFFSI